MTPSGSSRGTAAARVTPYALDATRHPSAAGNSQRESSTTAPARARARSPRTAIVVPIAQRRPCANRSRNGPISGATIAKGSIVSPRNSATCPRASPVGTWKNSVPASEIATAASPAALTACSSIRRESPDAPAPSASAARRACRPTARPSRPVTRAAPLAPLPTARPACRARSRGAVPGDGRCALTPLSCRVPPTPGPAPDLTRGVSMGDDSPVTVTSMTTGRAKPDAVVVSAVDAARAALLEDVPAADVGEHLGVQVEGERVATHLFACTRRGYRGWRWSVTVARASRQKQVTVDEVVLIPSEDAIVAPEWVPYKERIQPGDLSPGDLLPVEEDDERLVPTYSFGEDDLTDDDRAQIRAVARELGLGRVRTLSPEGRDQAAQRWYDGDAGPDAPLAQAAPEPCRTCGFLLRVSGSLSETLRRVRQRQRQRRRPGGVVRPRVRRALGGDAAEEAPAPGDAGARDGHLRRRDRVLLIHRHVALARRGERLVAPPRPAVPQA